MRDLSYYLALAGISTFTSGFFAGAMTWSTAIPHSDTPSKLAPYLAIQIAVAINAWIRAAKLLRADPEKEGA